MGEQDPEWLKEELCKCVICGKRLMGTCGTPYISWYGCCVGFRKGKTIYIRRREAHIECWFEKEKNPKLMKEIK